MKVLAPLPIGFAVFMVHLATIPITGTGINPARSLGAAVIYNNSKAWSDQVGAFFVELQFSLKSQLKGSRELTFLLFISDAVDLLGGPVHRRGDRSAVPPDRPPRQRKGIRFLPEQRLDRPPVDAVGLLSPSEFKMNGESVCDG
jgi:hypothetical protein